MSLIKTTIESGQPPKPLQVYDFANLMHYGQLFKSLQIYDFQQDDTLTVMNKALRNQGINLYSDGSLLILNNVNLPKFKVTFDGMFPYYLSTLTFDATQSDLEYFTAQVSFKYNIYNIVTI